MLRSRFAPAALLATSCLVFAPAFSATFGQEPEAAPAAASEEEDRIGAALDEPTSLTVRDAPLRDLVHRLRELTRANVILDRKALEDIGLTDDIRLSGDYRDISLRSILNLLFRPVDLTWMVHEGALVITTPEETETTLSTRVYNVADLVDRRVGDEDAYDAENLVVLIQSVVAPDTWETVGGPATFGDFRGTIIIEQMDRVHDQIEALLAALRKASRLNGGGAEGPAEVSVHVRPEAESAIFAALARPVSLDLRQTPLREVPAILQSKLGVQAVLDLLALDDVGMSDETPVSLSVESMRAEQALRHLLGQLELTWQVRDEVLVITTHETAESDLETRVYPVRDLHTPPDDVYALGLPDVSDSLTNLVHVIESNVSPEMWDVVGGPGDIESLPGAGVIAVSQTMEVHQRIERLLVELRRKLAEPAPDAEHVSPDDSLTLAIYHIPFAPGQTPGAAPSEGDLRMGPPIPADELVPIITELVEPESWTREGAYIRAVPGRLVIRQTASGHRQVKKILIRLKLMLPPSAIGEQGFGGGFGGGGFF